MENSQSSIFNSQFSKTGILLVNLGTPDAPSSREVRRYLREFLSDKRVIDLPPLGRQLLLNFIILPFRPRKSARAYQQIWMKEGAPLLVYGQKLTNALTDQFATEQIPVELGMRYGSPSLKNALGRLREQGCDRIVAVPLYPQYAASTFGSAVEALYKEVSHYWNMQHLQIIPPFFSDSAFIEAWAKVGLPYLVNKPDHVLFSFHGLPKRHLLKSDETKKWCKNDHVCSAELLPENRHCYRAQCYHTAQLLAERLNLEPQKWSVSFQSRLGRDEWSKPYTEQHLTELVERGVKRLVVFCPAFVADGLETLEEIGIRSAGHFRKHGGEEFNLVPSLNDHPEWVAALSSIIRKQILSV